MISFHSMFSLTLVDLHSGFAAEQHLNEAQKIPGHPLIVLQLVASDSVNPSVRQAAAVHFKNIVKKGWDADAEDGTDGIVISDNDRGLIKSHLVNLMCTAPPQIQAQCSEAISLIAEVDFPKRWENLLPELIEKFNSPDPNVVCGVLATANSILKRFRYIERSDSLYADIIYVLERIQAPLLTLFNQMGQAIDAYSNDAAQLKPRIAAMRYMCRIFYSLNWQDLPEFFEDHMAQFMGVFEKYLEYSNPLLVDEDEELEPSPIDSLQTAVVNNLFLYGDKDEEVFVEQHLPKFTTLVWNLLMRLTTYPKHDILATTCIKFLASLIGKQMHKNLFQDPNTLKQIISNIVIPNLMIREADEERFEDDPESFIMGDMEDCDNESRRKGSQNLLKAMNRQFEQETTTICLEHIKNMLAEFSSSPNSKWAAKDAAIHLMLAISIRAESGLGVSSTNDMVNIMDFFNTHILTELQDTNHMVRPMVKATAIKFVWTFRNQFSSENISALFPLMINHLGSPSVVVHTYCAAAIGKFLSCKNDGGQGLKFGGDQIKPFLGPLFTGLFAIVDNTEWNENEYVMKCIMMSLFVAREYVVDVTQIVLEKLNAALFVVAKNPRNPQYNHYMFESIAVLVKAVCSKHPEHGPTFENLLFPPFQQVLQMNVAEFVPYVFQILAQLLEFRPENTGLGDAYGALLSPLMTASLWEVRGNVPALTRLIQAYLMKGSTEIASQGSLNSILGIFQKLVSSKATENNGLELLRAITLYVQKDTIQPMMKQIMQILMMRMQNMKTPRFQRLFSEYFAQLLGQYGSEYLIGLMNEIQPGMFVMILQHIWVPLVSGDFIPTPVEAKIQVVGLTKVICETPLLLQDANGQQLWIRSLTSVAKILTSQQTSSSVDTEDVVDSDIGYDPTFSRLHFASRPQLDPFKSINATQAFTASFQNMMRKNGGIIQPLMQQGQTADPKTYAAFENLMSRAGI